MQQLANNAQSTLSATITNTATSLVVVSASAFPTSGNFHILIETEIILVTAVSGTTFTITRAQEGTTAVGHNSGVTVTAIITKAALENYRSDFVITSLYSSRPSVAINNRIFLPTDINILNIDNGTTWDNYGTLYPLTPIDTTSFSWVNQGSATLDTTYVIPHISCSSNGGTDSWKMFLKSTPTPPYTVTVGMIPKMSITSNSCAAGVGWRDSVGGHFHHVIYNGTKTMYIQEWNSTTSFNTNYSTKDGFLHSVKSLLWLQLVDDNTSRKINFSTDGFTWINIDSRSRSYNFTPNQIGFDINPYNVHCGVSILSYLETSP